MRNLKKILALVLALVMSLSLMATASAAEAAAAANDYSVAVEVLRGLGVVRGDEGGIREIDPITRAEVAALAYRIHTADVTDSKADLYYEIAPFTDLDPVKDWALGYIGYAHNAQIVKGNGDNTFSPTGKITGYEVLAMALRAIGYGKNGEFEGAEWQINTAAWARRELLLEGVSYDDQTRLDQPASRGMVFQILLNAVLHEDMGLSYVTPDLYASTNTGSMAARLGLERITGVITANEYADLESLSTLAENKTRVLVDGVSYTITHSTGLDDIGETCLAYIKDGKEVLSLTDDGKDYPETFDETALSKFLSDNGLKTNDDTEWFINFGPITNWTSDWKIKYVVEFDWEVAIGGSENDPSFVREVNNEIRSSIEVRGFTFSLPTYVANTNTIKTHIDSSNAERYDLKWVTDANGSNVCTGITYTREFAIKEDIGPAHQDNITIIFNIADKTVTDAGNYVTGEVYVGTTSVEDISDKKSLEQFKAEYISTDDEDSISGNENGNWLKVIDNDGDGYAEYVLKTIYTFAQVSNVKDDVYTLDTKNEALCAGSMEETVNLLTSQEVSPETEMELGDVVYYAIIDGVARAYKADMVTATIEKVDHNGEYAVTSDGVQYDASGVHEHILDPDYKGGYNHGLVNLAGKVTYDLYFDRGGYLGVFIESNTEHGFKLVVDGWFNSTKTGYEYAMKVYNDETGSIDVVDINSTGSRFIGKDVEYWDGYKIRQTDNNDWNALKYLGGVKGVAALTDNGNNDAVGITSINPATLNGDSNVRNNDLKTTVVAITSDNGVLPVENTAVDNRGQHFMIDIPGNTIPKAGMTSGDIYVTSIGNNSDTAYDLRIASGVEVRALTSTVYYAVYKDASGNARVMKSVGYSDVPSYSDIEDVYVVATPQSRISNVGNDTGYGSYDDYKSTYYTAEVVVIELGSYEDDSVPVLVYDSPFVYSDVTIDNVKMIDDSGKAVEVDIDLQRSKLDNNNYVEYGVAGRKALRPGLYWRTPTTTEGLYTLEPMTREEIRDNFTVGQVYTGKQSGLAWVDISVLTTTNGFNGFLTKGVERSDKPVSYVPSGNEVFWTLSYGNHSYTTATLTPSTESVVFSEQPDRSTRYERVDWYDAIENGGMYNPAEGDMAWNSFQDDNRNDYWDSGEASWNFNDVLVYANDKGSIVYAVSFQNLVNESSSDTTLDYAQAVWLNCLGAPEEAAASTETFGTFYGWKFGVKDGNAWVETAGSARAYITEQAMNLTYAEATMKTPAGLVVTYTGATYKTPAVTPADPVNGVGEIELVVEYNDVEYTFTFSVEKAHTGNTLATDQWIKVEGETVAPVSGVKMTLADYAKTVEDAQKAANADLTNATFVWYFEDSKGEISGTRLGTTNISDDELTGWTVTVTSEAGVPKTYTFGTVNVPDGPGSGDGDDDDTRTTATFVLDGDGTTHWWTNPGEAAEDRVKTDIKVTEKEYEVGDEIPVDEFFTSFPEGQKPTETGVWDIHSFSDGVTEYKYDRDVIVVGSTGEITVTVICYDNKTWTDTPEGTEVIVPPAEGGDGEGEEGGEGGDGETEAPPVNIGPDKPFRMDNSRKGVVLASSSARPSIGDPVTYYISYLTEDQVVSRVVAVSGGKEMTVSNIKVYGKSPDITEGPNVAWQFDVPFTASGYESFKVYVINKASMTYSIEVRDSEGEPMDEAAWRELITITSDGTELEELENIAADEVEGIDAVGQPGKGVTVEKTVDGNKIIFTVTVTPVEDVEGVPVNVTVTGDADDAEVKITNLAGEEIENGSAAAVGELITITVTSKVPGQKVNVTFVRDDVAGEINNESGVAKYFITSVMTELNVEVNVESKPWEAAVELVDGNGDAYTGDIVTVKIGDTAYSTTNNTVAVGDVISFSVSGENWTAKVVTVKVGEEVLKFTGEEGQTKTAEHTALGTEGDTITITISVEDKATITIKYDGDDDLTDVKIDGNAVESEAETKIEPNEEFKLTGALKSGNANGYVIVEVEDAASADQIWGVKVDADGSFDLSGILPVATEDVTYVLYSHNGELAVKQEYNPAGMDGIEIKNSNIAGGTVYATLGGNIPSYTSFETLVGYFFALDGQNVTYVSAKYASGVACTTPNVPTSTGDNALGEFTVEVNGQTVNILLDRDNTPINVYLNGIIKWSVVPAADAEVKVEGMKAGSRYTIQCGEDFYVIGEENVLEKVTVGEEEKGDDCANHPLLDAGQTSITFKLGSDIGGEEGTRKDIIITDGMYKVNKIGTSGEADEEETPVYAKAGDDIGVEGYEGETGIWFSVTTTDEDEQTTYYNENGDKVNSPYFFTLTPSGTKKNLVVKMPAADDVTVNSGYHKVTAADKNTFTKVFGEEAVNGDDVVLASVLTDAYVKNETTIKTPDENSGYSILVTPDDEDEEQVLVAYVAAKEGETKVTYDCTVQVGNFTSIAVSLKGAEEATTYYVEADNEEQIDLYDFLVNTLKVSADTYVTIDFTGEESQAIAMRSGAEAAPQKLGEGGLESWNKEGDAADKYILVSDLESIKVSADKLSGEASKITTGYIALTVDATALNTTAGYGYAVNSTVSAGEEGDDFYNVNLYDNDEGKYLKVTIYVQYGELVTVNAGEKGNCTLMPMNTTLKGDNGESYPVRGNGVTWELVDMTQSNDDSTENTPDAE